MKTSLLSVPGKLCLTVEIGMEDIPAILIASTEPQAESLSDEFRRLREEISVLRQEIRRMAA